MSERERRDISRLNYQVLHSTGEKVEKEVDRISQTLEGHQVTNMALVEKLKNKEKKILVEFQNMVEITELQTMSEIEEYLSEIREIKKSYLNIHVDLEDELGQQVYQEMYKNYKKVLSGMKTCMNEAISLRRQEKSEKEDNIRKEEKGERVRREKEKEKKRQAEKEERDRIRQEEKEERDRIREEEKAERLNFEKERLEREQVRINAEEKFRQEQKAEIEHIREEEKKERDRIEQERLKREELEFIEKDLKLQEEKNRKENLSKCLIEENESIKKTIEGVCNVVLGNEADETIIAREKKISFLDTDIRRYGDNLSKLIEQISFDDKDREIKISEFTKVQKSLLDNISSYKESISSEIAARALSGENFRSLPSLSFELQTFSGYDSKIDIYTFQTEFEKLFASSVQKKYVAKYLKSNYLRGSALSLVQHLDDIMKIWDRLKEAFGNTEMILKWKLKEIENLGAMWKMKDNEKIAQILCKLIFTMEELIILAVKYDLEGELYYNSAIIAKIYDIMGYQHRDKFVRKNSEEKVPLKKPQIWKKLIKYLTKEL